jgi:hypothetical protein
MVWTMVVSAVGMRPAALTDVYMMPKPRRALGGRLPA